MKLKMVNQFLEQFYGTDAQHLDILYFMRLLLPSLDRQRGNYGLKESNIAKFYADILTLPQKEADRLIHWKNPTK